MTTTNNIWNDIQHGVKKLYVNKDLTTTQKDKILVKAKDLMNSYDKKFNKDIVRLNNFYKINNTRIEGIKYSAIMNIIVKEFDKRGENNRQKEKEKRDDVERKNKPNKDWQLYQMDHKTNSPEGYHSGKKENNKEIYELEENDNKDVSMQKLKKKELIENYKGDLDKLFEISKTPKYPRSDHKK